MSHLQADSLQLCVLLEDMLDQQVRTAERSIQTHKDGITKEQEKIESLRDRKRAHKRIEKNRNTSEKVDESRSILGRDGRVIARVISNGGENLLVLDMKGRVLARFINDRWYSANGSVLSWSSDQLAILGLIEK